MDTIQNKEGIEGIIIRLYPSGDADVIIRVLSPAEGKFSIFAPRARKSSSRGKTNPAVDILDWGIFETRSGKGNLPILRHFFPRSSFPRIRQNFEKLILASFMCEIYDVAIPENLPDEGATFHSLWNNLEKLDKSESLAEAFQTVFQALLYLLEENGILAEIPQAGTHALLSLSAQLERYTGRNLMTKEQLPLAIQALKREKIKKES